MMDEMTALQRDILILLQGLQPASGVRIQTELEAYYGSEVFGGRLYPALDNLVECGYLEKSERDGRTNKYALTVRGRKAIQDRYDWLQSLFEPV